MLQFIWLYFGRKLRSSPLKQLKTVFKTSKTLHANRHILLIMENPILSIQVYTRITVVTSDIFLLRKKNPKFSLNKLNHSCIFFCCPLPLPWDHFCESAWWGTSIDKVGIPLLRFLFPLISCHSNIPFMQVNIYPLIIVINLFLFYSGW